MIEGLWHAYPGEDKHEGGLTESLWFYILVITAEHSYVVELGCVEKRNFGN